MQNVTLGGNIGKKRKIEGKGIIFSPIIGKNVFIGPGASVLGPILVGDNSIIGAGAVVLNDIPKNGVAIGIPAKVTKILSEEDVLNNI